MILVIIKTFGRCRSTKDLTLLAQEDKLNSGSPSWAVALCQLISVSLHTTRDSGSPSTDAIGAQNKIQDLYSDRVLQHSSALLTVAINGLPLKPLWPY